VKIPCFFKKKLTAKSISVINWAMKEEKNSKKPKKKEKSPSKTDGKLSFTNKQKIFIAEYLVDLDGAQAAIRAGYSRKSANSISAENLSKPHIKAEIDRQIEERKKKLSVTAESVINELALVGFANMADFIVIDGGGGIQAIPLDQLTEGKSRIIKKVKEKRVIRTVKGTKDKPEGEEILDATYEFELCDKVKSLELLSRHLGILHDKQEVDLKQPLNITIKKFYRGKDGTTS
jgi:phage terminase small subunit